MAHPLETSKEVDRSNFIYVPSIGLHVATERSHFGKNWYEAHEALGEENSRMLTLPESVEFLRYTRTSHPEFYDELVSVRDPLEGEWLDAHFEQREDGLYVLTGNKPGGEKFDGNTLREDKTPGISLEDWMENPTNQGFPRKDVKEGDLHYWRPISGDAANFVNFSDKIFLKGGGNPGLHFPWLGVRAAKRFYGPTTPQRIVFEVI